MGKENRKERDSFLSKFMYFHEWKNDTCKKYEKGKETMYKFYEINSGRDYEIYRGARRYMG